VTATQKARFCEICGGSIRSDNEFGICARRNEPKCLAARRRKQLGLPEAEERHCEICGGPLRSNNTTGFCRKTPECSREATRRDRAAKGPGRLQKKKCNRGACPKPAASHGVCVMHAARFRKTGDYGPDEPLVVPLVINPGERFGHWTVLEAYSPTHQRILCQCDCGSLPRPVWAYTLVSGESQSCNCGRRKPHPPAEPYMRAGEVHGFLTALEDATYGSDAIRFRCECRDEPVIKNAGQVKRGQTKSCGHLRQETFYRHGLSRHPLYHIWKGMIRRCENPKDPAYKDYKEHHITVCEGWHGVPDGLLRFAAHMGERPPGRTVDRPDNEGGYWCGHCAECTANGWPPNAAWKTPKEQNANRRSVHTMAPRLNAALAEIERLKQLLKDGGIDDPL
jgi:hypothetical protein